MLQFNEKPWYYWYKIAYSIIEKSYYVNEKRICFVADPFNLE